VDVSVREGSGCRCHGGHGEVFGRGSGVGKLLPFSRNLVWNGALACDGVSEKETAKDSGMKKSDAEHGHMTITDVKMVSESCK
jgi:hypothetical protein